MMKASTWSSGNFEESRGQPCQIGTNIKQQAMSSKESGLPRLVKSMDYKMMV
jgi:hypothetical protein